MKLFLNSFSIAGINVLEEISAIFVSFFKILICSFCRNSRNFFHSDYVPITEPSTRAPAFIVIPVFAKIF